jgi:tetraacyldisaccharide 4'-kinase
MERRLTELWYRESAGFSLLAPLAWLYGLVMALRRAAYAGGLLKTHRAGKPVIVVGNLTVGGTGKTPLVAWLAEQLSLSGLRVGIVSRGYGRSKSGPEGVHAESSWRDVGDEPMLLWKLTGCDVVVSQDRFAGAQQLVALGVDVVIADDGLQHLRLARDCEIVVIDGARGFGNGRLLPAGPLREPASRVRNANIVVVNGAPEHASLQPREGKSAFAEGKKRAFAEGTSEERLQMSLWGGEAHRVDGLAAPALLDHFRGRRVHAVAGIGNPQRFFRDLRAHGIEVVEHPFPDHHPFTAAELTFGDDLPVLMTQKDAVRCPEIENARLWYVRWLRISAMCRPGSCSSA